MNICATLSGESTFPPTGFFFWPICVFSHHLWCCWRAAKGSEMQDSLIVDWTWTPKGSIDCIESNVTLSLGNKGMRIFLTLKWPPQWQSEMQGILNMWSFKIAVFVLYEIYSEQCINFKSICQNTLIFYFHYSSEDLLIYLFHRRV